MTSCQAKLLTIPRPPKPKMFQVESKGNCVCGDQLDNVVSNMWELQIYCKKLEANPCYK